ncbi:biopolymer transporter ExbB [Ovoidimarina sediminis]|uniref:biopolymer transporter ExbB n=1 Tax=Ovoidimarina sediminis TaxID=3079856 RepID=UPI00291427C0|nr:biopolymer transporter ExbB [Rhodophyticola sp. MJ-SS7]MDU8943249.1 biopolymer transporter ExbB [Rhodophyticola sp. MJ-SS7]
MDRLEREAQAQFTQPVRQIILMIIVLLLVGGLAYIAWPTVAPVFLANLWLNGVIGAVFVIGVLACFWQLWQLVSSVIWIEGFVQERPGHQFTRAPRLLASLAALLRARGARAQLGTSSSRSILDSVATRIDEARDITRYIVNVLIFLGLLGTFYGLATTVPAVVDTIRSLAPAEGEDLGGVNVFSRLITGLEAQLGGMGVAFSSSLIGLAGSLVVGLLELFASHGQNQFYRQLEDWLSTITRVGFAGGDADGDSGGGGATAAVLDHMAEQMDALTTLYESSDASRNLVDERLSNLAASVERLVERIEREDTAEATLARLAAGQERLAAALESGVGGGGETDAEARMRLRSMDVQLLKILEELASGRQEMMDDLRADIHNLTRAVEALGRGG